MNQNVSRTEAHKIFANLYRKNRSPEHQAKVDEIITRSNDVFIRIDLIKKLDEEFEKKMREQILEGRKANSEGQGRQDSKNQTQAKVQATTGKEKEHKEKEDDGGGSFIGRLFGTNNSISRFAKETRAIDLGLLGRKQTISPNVEKLFKFLSEDEIIGTAQALKYSEQVGWKLWNPREYNIVLNFGRFFNAFISLDSLFKDEISPEVFLGRSTKMIMYYIRVLNIPETREIIMDKVPSLVKMETKLAPRMDAIMRGLSFALTLESRRPTLKDAITAFYVVQHKRVPSWEEIEKSMSVSPIDETRYGAPPDVLKQIEMSVAKISNEINTKISIVNELQTIQKNYFRFKQDGEIDLDFIDAVVDDYVAHYYSENIQADSIKSNIRHTPPKLLQTLCRDIQTLYLPIMEGYVKIDNLGPKDVLIIQPGLLFPEIDKINNIIRSFDAFNRKFQSFNYTFQKYSEDLSKGTTDQIESQLVKLMSDAADFFGKFAKKLSVIVENDNLARAYEKSGQINEKTLTTKEKVIEEIKIMQRFIPYGDAKLITQNRLNGKPVRHILLELTMMLFNYAVLFRDESIIEMLSNTKKYEADLSKLTTEFERLSGKPFVPAGKEAE